MPGDSRLDAASETTDGETNAETDSGMGSTASESSDASGRTNSEEVRETVAVCDGSDTLRLRVFVEPAQVTIGTTHRS